MQGKAILETISDLARTRLGWAGGALVPEMRLVEDLNLDSIRLLTLATDSTDGMIATVRRLFASRKVRFAVNGGFAAVDLLVSALGVRHFVRRAEHPAGVSELDPHTRRSLGSRWERIRLRWASVQQRLR